METGTVVLDSRSMNLENSLVLDFVNSYKNNAKRVMSRGEISKYRRKNAISTAFYKGKRVQKSDNKVNIKQMKTIFSEVKDSALGGLNKIMKGLGQKFDEQKKAVVRNSIILANNLKSVKNRAIEDGSRLSNRVLDDLYGVKEDSIILGQYIKDSMSDFKDNIIRDVTTRPKRAKRNRFGIDAFLIIDKASETKNNFFNKIEDLTGKLKVKKQEFSDAAERFLDATDVVADKLIDFKEKVNNDVMDYLYDIQDNINAKANNVINDITT